MLITTLVTLITSSLLGLPPNVCDDAYLNAAGEPIVDSTGHTLARHCEWRGPDAPPLEANVCCSIEDDVATCTLANLRGYCSSGVRMWCAHGEVDSSTGRVTCHQVFPDACKAGHCIQAPSGEPEKFDGALCCYPGGCFPVELGESLNCEGEFAVCEWGMSLPDGTVECFE